MSSRAWQQACERAQRAWPGVRLSEARFRAHLATLGYGAAPPPFAADAYLACASALGDPAACRALDAAHAGAMRSAIRGACRRADLTDDVLQSVRAKLLIGPPPALLKYSGRAPLEAWLRLLARRTALDAERAARRMARRDTAVAIAIAAPTVDDELDRRRCRELVQDALSRELARLPQRERSALRLHYAADLGIDALAGAFGVHRATVARWLEKSERTLRQRVHARLRAALGAISSDELRHTVMLVAGEGELAIPGWHAGGANFSRDTRARTA